MPYEPTISVVIPTRGKRDLGPTVQTLMAGSMKPGEIIVVYDGDRRGACWARNTGAEKATGRFLLFSDDDILWELDALETMYRLLLACPDASYSYGWYLLNDRAVGREEFSLKRLRERNFVSTMSLIRREDFPGFDEDIKRYQDWDLWLQMAAEGKFGVFTSSMTFATKPDKWGITQNSIPEAEAVEAVKKKHGIPHVPKPKGDKTASIKPPPGPRSPKDYDRKFV